MLHSTALAAPTTFSDVQTTDWYYPYVQAMVNKGLISGYADGTFLPSATLTQGEFLTMLARTFYPGILANAQGGKHWATNAYNAARSTGVLWADEFLEMDADSLGTPADRKTVCVLFERLMTTVCNMPKQDTTAAMNKIADFGAIDFYYKDGILQSYARGIVSGYTDGCFHPDRTITRAEACVMISRAAGLPVSAPPQAPTTPPVQTPQQPSVQAPVQMPTANSNWYVKGDNADKRLRIFGTSNTNKYENEAAAKANIVEVCVPVWRLNKATGEKKASKQYFLVNKALAEDVVKIFTEIYNDPSQFPIYEIGGYNWRSNANTSEHNSGLAIDINANENYQIYPDGRIGAGSYWKPYEDPHSIPEDGIVVRTFEKYGFSWGGNSWTSNKDYMHFSYLGR